MRVFELIHDRDIVQLDVQVLVDALQCAAYRYIVFEFHRHFCIDKSLEETTDRSVQWFL